MHNKFVDKNRRLINLRQMQVKNVLPEHYVSSYPKFISLLEKYYEWQDEQNATELLNHLFASRDINETDITLLSYIEDELLLGDAYFEGFGQNEAELRAAANFSNTLFRSKGSKFAIEWFFRSFYGVDAEVLYPKENVFELNDLNSSIGGNSLRFLTDDKLYQTYALLVRVGIPISKWNDTFKLFAHPAGMYLGGEVLLTDSKNIVIALPQGDSAVTSGLSIPSYTLTPQIDSVDEGQSVLFTVKGTNVVDNIDAVYYYIENITTSDSDFVSFYDSNNKQYVSINDSNDSAVGTFSIPLATDVLEDESAEQFRVILLDRNENVQDSAIITINNVGSPYYIEVLDGDGPNGNAFDEYEVIEFRITADSTAPLNATLNYYLDNTNYIPAVTLDKEDFVGVIPTVANPQSITLDGDSARFTLQTNVDVTDTIQESTENFEVILRKNSTEKDRVRVLVRNVTPTYTLTFADDSVIEGNSLQATIDIDNFNVGNTISWSLTGDIASDSRTLTPSGSFVTDSTSTTFAIPFSSNDSATTSGVAGTLDIDLITTKSTVSSVVSRSFTLIDSDAVYNIVATPSSAGAGDSATFSFSGTNIPDGTQTYFYVDYNQTDSNDFVTNPPLTDNRTTITFNNNVGSPDVSLQFTNDADDEETFIAILSDSSTGGNNLKTRSFNISAVEYAITASTTSVNEGNSVLFTFGPSSGTKAGTYNYILSGTGITSNDFTSLSLTGTFNVSTDGGSGSFSTTLRNDVFFEGTETFSAEVFDSNNVSLITSPTVSINDTSIPVYSLIAPDVTEGNSYNAIISGSSSGERIYFEITGDAADKFTTTQTSVIINSNPKTIPFGTTLDSDAYEANPSGTLTASRGDYASNGGTSVGTDTFRVLDRTATATLTASNTTPSEDSAVTFTISNSTNLTPTRYYSLDSDIVPVKTSSSSSLGQSFINLENTTGLLVGQETPESGINGTINVIQSGGVYMTQNLISTIPANTILHFAKPSVFADFSNLPYGSTDSDTFVIDIALDSDTQNDTYTFVLRDSEYGGNDIATEQITIQDETVSVDIDVSTTTLQNNANTDTFCRIRFVSNGDIYGHVSSVFQKIGTWIDNPSVTGSNYTVYAEKLSGDFVTGSLETTLTLDVNRDWSVTALRPPVPGTTFKTASVRFTVQGPSGSDNDIRTFQITAAATRVESSEGGGECFVAGTKVLIMNDKYVEKNIEDVTIEDTIIGFDTESGEFVSTSFEEFMTPYYRDETIKIHFTDGSFVHTTTEHPFLVGDEYKVVSFQELEERHRNHDVYNDVSGELQVGDAIVGVNGDKVVASIEYCEGEMVYNLMRSSTKNFIVNGVVTHNK